MTNPLGIYIHIPFCVSKCTYCNFYSFKSSEELKNKYTSLLINQLKKWGAEISRPISSVYIGGGTPTALGGSNLFAVLDAVNNNFNLLPNAEITTEGNPADNLDEIIPFLKKGGCNRFSLGVQSANDNELKILGRRHTVRDAENAVKVLKASGINNISVDLMLGLPNSNPTLLKNSIDFALSLDVPHISAYILKLEEGTPLFKSSDKFSFPNEDDICEQYLFLCGELENKGYEHYEISNFCKCGYPSQHNTAYWKCKEYIGLGPSAHSFLNGKRFYYPNEIEAYMNSPTPIFDDIGGTKEEYIMLSLRLKEGISAEEFKDKFNCDLPNQIFDKAKILQKQGLCDIINNSISLTNKGMLVSNSIINYFLEEL